MTNMVASCSQHRLHLFLLIPLLLLLLLLETNNNMQIGAGESSPFICPVTYHTPTEEEHRKEDDTAVQSAGPKTAATQQQTPTHSHTVRQK